MLQDEIVPTFDSLAPIIQHLEAYPLGFMVIVINMTDNLSPVPTFSESSGFMVLKTWFNSDLKNVAAKIDSQSVCVRWEVLAEPVLLCPIL